MFHERLTVYTRFRDKTTAHYVREDTNVSQLKQIVAERLGPHVNSVQLLLKGKEISNDNILQRTEGCGIDVYKR